MWGVSACLTGAACVRRAAAGRLAADSLFTAAVDGQEDAPVGVH